MGLWKISLGWVGLALLDFWVDLLVKIPRMISAQQFETPCKGAACAFPIQIDHGVQYFQDQNWDPNV